MGAFFAHLAYHDRVFRDETGIRPLAVHHLLRTEFDQ
jgi:hypothetical protein